MEGHFISQDLSGHYWKHVYIRNNQNDVKCMSHSNRVLNQSCKSFQKGNEGIIEDWWPITKAEALYILQYMVFIRPTIEMFNLITFNIVIKSSAII